MIMLVAERPALGDYPPSAVPRRSARWRTLRRSARHLERPSHQLVGDVQRFSEEKRRHHHVHQKAHVLLLGRSAAAGISKLHAIRRIAQTQINQLIVEDGLVSAEIVCVHEGVVLPCIKPRTYL